MYKNDFGWNNPASWVQINVTSEQIPIQRVPTELDDVVFSKAMSGISHGVISVDKEDDTITVGVNRTSGIRCRSLHISNFIFELGSPFYEYYPTIIVSTAHGGYVLIDSNSTSLTANFYLEGGDPDIYDLQLLDSKLGEIKAHNLYLGSLFIGSKGRAQFKNSIFGCPAVQGSQTGGEFYAENCTFNSFGLWMGASSKVTLLKSTFTDLTPAVSTLTFSVGPNSNFISSDVQLVPAFSLALSLSGAVFNGNIKQIWSVPGGLQIIQQDTTNPLPTIVNGNVEVFAQGLNLSGGLKISGDFINHATEWDMYPDSSRVYINGQEIFKIGGISNYGNSTNLNNCTMLGCHFKVEFFGEKDSKVVWPVGFPIDTLVINKTNCGKVTFENPVYVSGETRIEKGQLVLNPNDIIPYKLVSAGDVKIAKGGGIFLRRNDAGVVANIAVAGSIYDQNTVVDSTCTGLSNPYNSTITLYRSSLNSRNHTVVLASNASIGDMNFIGEEGTEIGLGGNLTINNFTFTNPGNLLLGDHDLTIYGNIVNYGTQNFFVTNGTGKLQLNNMGSKETVFPVGTSAASYTPVTITNTGTPDNFRVNVKDKVFANGSSGGRYVSGVVDKTWNIEEATPGGSHATVKLQWNGADELNGFSRTTAHLSHYTSGNWDRGTEMTAEGANPYWLTRSAITSFSPFAVMGFSPTLPLTLVSFNGQYKHQAVELFWSTEYAANVKSFTLEKSADRVLFTAIATMPAINGTGGRMNYQFSDRLALQKINYYRLKTTDLDGIFTYSKTIAVAATEPRTAVVFPNPVKDQFFIQLPINVAGATIQLFDTKGMSVRSMKANGSSTIVPVNVMDLTTGVYLLVINANGRKNNVFVVKQ